jgi:transcription-repair coupling factor (superfamily II helicase)
MSLRPLLGTAAEHPRFHSLASAVREGGSMPVHMSPSIQPYLLAALVEAPDGLAGRPVLVVAADDIGARDLARELRAYLAPRRVRYYPSRGTGYASHVAPPPHLVGLRIAALDALTKSDPAVVVASAVALAEAVPDAALRPAGLTLDRGTEVDLGEVAALLVEAGYEHIDQVEERGQFAVRGGILDVFGATEERAARLELFGDEIESIRWFSTFTQRSLGEADRVELSPAAELASEHRELAELALEDDPERPDLAELLPLESFRAPLELIPSEAAVIITAAEEIHTALSDHWDDVTTAIHDADARRLYVDVAAALDARASLKIHGISVDPEPSSQAEAGLSFRAPAPASAARTIGEAESQLERELRSGNRVVVAFENRGEAERARYNLNRLDVGFLDDASLADPLAAVAEPSTRMVLFGEAELSDGFVSADLSLAVIPFRRLVHRRRAAAPGPARGPLATFSDLRVGD